MMEEQTQEYYLNKLSELQKEINTIENNLSKLFKLLFSLICISGFVLIIVPFILKYIE